MTGQEYQKIAPVATTQQSVDHIKENLARVDPFEIRQSLNLLTELGQVAELRALNTCKATVSGYFGDLDALTKAAIAWSGKASGVYITLNPVKKDLLARACNRVELYAKHATTDAEITTRRWFPIDLDAVRPAGISATETEHEAALQRARDCREWLRALGWHKGVYADSGNGAHLLYRIDLPNDDASRNLLARCLKALAARFDNGAVTVDQSVHNTARIWKLYGTLVCKGDSLPERPHRLARLIAAPDELVVVSRAQLEVLAAQAPDPKPKTNSSTGRKESASGGDFFKSVNTAALDSLNQWVLALFPKARQYRDGWRVSSADLGRNMEEDLSIQPAGIRDFGVHDLGDPRQGGRTPIDLVIEHKGCDAAEAAKWLCQQIGRTPESLGWRTKGSGKNNHDHRAPSDSASEKLDTEPPTIITAAELWKTEFAPVRWTVPDLLPEGTTILAGAPKLCKSWLALGLGVAVAVGGVALGHKPVEKGDVLYLALEDNARRLKSRLKNLMVDGAVPPDRLHLATDWPRLDAGGAEQIEAWLQAHPSARLVIIDTLEKARPSTFKTTDSTYTRDYAAGHVLTRISGQYGISILVIHHTRKLDTGDPLDLVSGTLGLSGGVDGVMVLRRERGTADAYLFITGRDIEEESDYAMSWDKHTCTWTIKGLAEDYKRSQERQEVIELLRAQGPLGPKVIAECLEKKAGAVRKLLMTMVKSGELASSGGTYSVPTEKSGNTGNSGSTGNVGNTGNTYEPEVF